MKRATFIKPILLCLSFFLLFSGTGFGAIPAIERQALIALYNSTDGDNWTNNSGWKTPPLDTDGFAMPGTESGWVGVYINYYHVFDIYLVSNNLAGTIPPELGNFVNLGGLTLSYNHLTGSIPPELGNLTKLRYLDLDNNQFTGTIPPELENLTSLWYLWLHNNQLTGTIPPELGNLTKLWQLSLDANQLTGIIPPEIGNLQALVRLSINGNNLTGPVPESITNLTNLVNNDSDFCDNYLYTDNATIRDFMNQKQIGGDWVTCQKIKILPGDLNGDDVVDLADAIAALQITVGTYSGTIHTSADVNGDDKIGMEEVIYILETVAGVR